MNINYTNLMTMESIIEDLSEDSKFKEVLEDAIDGCAAFGTAFLSLSADQNGEVSIEYIHPERITLKD